MVSPFSILNIAHLAEGRKRIPRFIGGARKSVHTFTLNLHTFFTKELALIS